jgi:MIP family channel proteins
VKPRSYNRREKLAAEFVGTFFVVLIAAGTAAIARATTDVSPVPPVQLTPLAAAIAYGAAYGAAIVLLGRVSGGHFNPAVTIGYWVTRRFGLFFTLAYMAAQLAGAAAAAYALRTVLPSLTAPLLGTPMLAAGTTRGPGMLIEAAMTFALVFALWATVADRQAPRYWLAGLLSAAVIVAAVFLGGPYTGGAMNPARAFGPALAAHEWTYQPVYWIGPLAGGVAAAWLYDLIFRRSRGRVHPVAETVIPRGY